MTVQTSILIVDDNVSLGKTMALILEHKGYTVAIATDGLQALKRVRERPFDVIFLDVKMGLMDGVETHRRIRGLRPQAKVVMMTAYAVEDRIQQALQQGACACLYKPFDMANVLRLVNEISEKSRPRAYLSHSKEGNECRKKSVS